MVRKVLGILLAVGVLGVFVVAAAGAAGGYAAEVLGYKTATSMAIDYAAGRASVEGFAAAFTERGGKMIQEQWIPVGTKDIAPYTTSGGTEG